MVHVGHGLLKSSRMKKMYLKLTKSRRDVKTKKVEIKTCCTKYEGIGKLRFLLSCNNKFIMILTNKAFSATSQQIHIKLTTSK